MKLIDRLGGADIIIEGILREFRVLCSVPHSSGHEKAECEIIRKRLAALGLTAEQDSAGNLRADIPAAPGCEAAPAVILQGHMDMVCAVAPGSGYRPLEDGITPVIRDGFLRSDGRSSLGADNGLGNAVVLWLLSKNLAHGPLRLIFTAAEEVGLEGARRLSPDWLSGAKYLLNTDGFHLGTAVISSAGGRRETYSRPVETAPPTLVEAFRLTLGGFAGGHSGDDIHRFGGNPLKLISAFLAALPFPWELAELRGGHAHNAIPTEAEAVLLTAPADAAALCAAVETARRDFKTRYGKSDSAHFAALSSCPMPASVWSADLCGDVLRLLNGLSCGVSDWRDDFPAVAANSANLGRVWTENRKLLAAEFLRCSSAEAECKMAVRHSRLASETRFALSAAGYPPWTGDPSNPLARLLGLVYRQETGLLMELSAVHVGLEPSFFQEKAPGLIMAVTGPDILGAHSPEERAPLSSLPSYAALLAGTLEALGRDTR